LDSNQLAGHPKSSRLRKPMEWGMQPCGVARRHVGIVVRHVGRAMVKSKAVLRCACTALQKRPTLRTTRLFYRVMITAPRAVSVLEGVTTEVAVNPTLEPSNWLAADEALSWTVKMREAPAARLLTG